MSTSSSFKYLLLISLLTIIFSLSGTAQKVSGADNLLGYYTSLGATDYVAHLMSRMTVDEKIGQLNLVTPGGIITGEIVSKGVEEKIRTGKVGGIFGIRGAQNAKQAQIMAVEHTRLGIPLLVGMDVIHGHYTIFPIPLGLSCSWDMSLIEKSARIAAKEATADGLMWTFSPMVDIARDPRWGRIAESSGEDPFLGSSIAKAMVRGYQGTDLADPTTMLACVKHFALYGAAEGGRDYAAADMSHVRMMNEYLPPYKAGIDAGVGSVMTSFNVIDYIPASGSKFLFDDILRKRWHFDGLVVSDYTSINEMIDHGMGDLSDVSALSLNAGIDMDMVGEGYLNTLKTSLEEGNVSIENLDKACIRILNAKEALGLFKDPYKYFDEKRATTDILSKANRDFARNAATKSIVLLKNNDQILPLSKDAKIALIGPLADSRRNMLGTWSVSGDYQKAITVLEGITSASLHPENIRYAKGANISDDREFAKKVNAFGEEIVIDPRTPDEMIKEAVDVAKLSDVIVAVVGEAADMSGEASSMTNLDIQPSQKKLLRALKELRKPIVMVLFNGRPMTILEESESMDAILDVWFGGTEGGNAVADVIFGNANPAGKLTTSFPVNVGQIPVYHSTLNTGRPDPGNRSKFKSNYLDAPNEPLYPFGFGLSYTQFSYGEPMLSKNRMTEKDSIVVNITIQNTGSRAGEEIVQMYIRDMVGSISRPVKELKGFEKIYLQPGQSREVSFTIKPSLLKFYDSNLDFIFEPGEFQVMIGPNSRDIKSLSFHLDVTEKVKP